MNFATLSFLVFTCVVLLIYWGLPEKFRTPVLLISSYIFYSFWDWRFSILLAALTLSNFWLTQVLFKTKNRSQKKNVLIACLSINLAVLGFFKYFGFFADGLVNLLDFFGFSANSPTLKILLPLGLSFFIFQIHNFTISVSFNSYSQQVISMYNSSKYQSTYIKQIGAFFLFRFVQKSFKKKIILF